MLYGIIDIIRVFEEKTDAEDPAEGKGSVGWSH